MLTKFKDCCLDNAIISISALVLFFLSHYTIHDDPIIIVGMLIVYLELSKLLYVVITGASAPIMLRYLMASIASGAAVKFYVAMIDKDLKWMMAYGLATFSFLFLRWVAIITTKDIR